MALNLKANICLAHKAFQGEREYISHITGDD